MAEHDSLGDLSVDLWDLARHQGRQTQDRLPRAVHRLVQRYCRARLGALTAGYGLADDLAVELTAALIRGRRRRLRGRAPVEAIVYPVMADAVDRALEQRRSSGACHTFAPGEPERRTADAALGPLGVEPSDDVLSRLDRLPRRAREVLVLRAFVGLSSEQVGRAMRLSPEKVRAEQDRALARLRSP